MSAPQPLEIVERVLLGRDLFAEIPKLYREAHGFAYYSGSQSESKVDVSGYTDPVGDAATDPSKMAARSDLAAGARLVVHALADLQGAVAAFRRIAHAANPDGTATASKLAAEGKSQWTAAEMEHAEVRSRGVVAAEDRVVRRRR